MNKKIEDYEQKVTNDQASTKVKDMEEWCWPSCSSFVLDSFFNLNGHYFFYKQWTIFIFKNNCYLYKT